MAFPFTQPELTAALVELAREGDAFWSSFSSSDFFNKPAESWSPAMNVLHLAKSTKPVAKAMKLPRFVLRLFFGKATAPSRRGDALRTLYLERIQGFELKGKYFPEAVRIDGSEVDTQRKLLASLTSAMHDLANTITKWNEADLERYQVPHPLLGKLTAREMLFFTLFHYQHHLDNVRQKLAGAE